MGTGNQLWFQEKYRTDKGSQGIESTGIKVAASKSLLV
jgi:hypothetical protein